MKTKLLALSVTTALLLSGCGSSDGSSELVSAATTDITVERGPVLKATTRDAKGQIGVSKGNGVYSFTEPTYPIESFGGYIDMNRNGIVDTGDVEMNYLRLRTNSGNVMTIATTMAENNDTLDALIADGYSVEELFTQRPSTDIDNAALSDEVYKYCIENNITDPALLDNTDMNTLRGKIQTRKEAYNDSDLDAETLEYALVNDELNITTMTEEDIPDVNVSSDQNIIDSIPLVALSIEQKATLAYMWDEERLAGNIYLALNELTPLNTFYNIATNAEAQHALSVEMLLEKYDLNVFNTTDFTGGYVAADMEYVSSNKEYVTPELTTLYDELYAKGSQSLQDALEVGCMVEVTDITDLDNDIDVAEGAEDIVMIYENLRSGSYSHYWAFDGALKNMGVSEGCCVAGDAYCKTTDEYPVDTKAEGEGYRYRHGQN